MGGIYLSEVIAERQLEIHEDRGRKRRAVVRLGKPVPDAEPGGDWCCSVQLSGLGDGRIRHAYGQDSFQALQLGVRMIRALLAAHRKREKVRITWLGEELKTDAPPKKNKDKRREDKSNKDRINKDKNRTKQKPSSEKSPRPDPAEQALEAELEKITDEQIPNKDEVEYVDDKYEIEYEEYGDAYES